MLAVATSERRGELVMGECCLAGEAKEERKERQKGKRRLTEEVQSNESEERGCLV